MTCFRLLAFVLPQILLLMLLGGHFDLLGGWNHTHGGFAVLILLFGITPILTLGLFVAEILQIRKRQKSGDKTPHLKPLKVAIFLCLETLTINLFILFQVRM
ncbi:MAG: hypothetical protein C0618_07855 [Desulfuromonas sp.]|nr:MAG: hypothetical protein C0618_07855 [Desulfuromonas sp.]